MIRFLWLLLFAACSHAPMDPVPGPASPPARQAPGTLALEAPGCLALLQGFCGGRGPAPNESAIERLAQAEFRERLRDQQGVLPVDLRQALERHRVFQDEPRRTKAGLDPLQEFLEHSEREHRWMSAILETELLRLQYRFGAAFDPRWEPMPLEYRLARLQEGLVLRGELARAAWSGHPEWRRVETTFRELKAEFQRWIGTRAIPESVRQAWQARMSGLKLVLPGASSDPELTDPVDPLCLESEQNAYYSPEQNEVMLCAGELVSGGWIWTLAHEMAHSLDVDSLRTQQLGGSPFGVTLNALRRDACSAGGVSCEQWERFKRGLGNQLETLAGWNPQLASFQRCLQRGSVRRTPSDQELQRQAEGEIDTALAGMAEQDLFVRMTEERVTRPDGAKIANPSFLNPCGYFPGSTRAEVPVDSELNWLVLFASEYRCSAPSDPVVRFRRALGTSRELGFAITALVLRMEGEYSARTARVRAGQASSPSERFADGVGSQVLARMLGGLRLPLVERRRRMLEASAWTCPAAGVGKEELAKGRLQAEVLQETHPFDTDRQKDFFSPPMRQVLECEKDFEFKDCQLETRPTGA